MFVDRNKSVIFTGLSKLIAVFLLLFSFFGGGVLLIPLVLRLLSSCYLLFGEKEKYLENQCE